MTIKNTLIMKKRWVFSCIIVMLILVSFSSAEMTQVLGDKWYTFGSVDIFVETDKASYNPGDSVYYTGLIRNNNPYSITEGKVRLQIFYHQEPEVEYMLDEFYVAEDIYLGPNETMEFGGYWDVPLTVKGGIYNIEGFYTIDQFNLAGVSFLRGLMGGISSFEVNYGTNMVYIDTQRIVVDGDDNISLHRYQPSQTAGEPVTVTVPIINEGYSTVARIKYQLYAWDDLREDFLVDEKIETIELPADGEALLTYISEPLPSTAYLLKIDVESGKNNNLLKLRVPVGGKRVKMNFLGIDKFPIEKGDTVNVFVDLSNSADYESSVITNISVDIKDKDGEVIFSDEIRGATITSDIIGYETSFIAEDDYNNITLSSNIYDDVGTHEFVDLVYFAEPEQGNGYALLAVFLLIILLILIIKTHRKTKKKKK